MRPFVDPDACHAACLKAAKGFMRTAAAYEADGDLKEAARLRDAAERHIEWAQSFLERPIHTIEQDEAA